MKLLQGSSFESWVEMSLIVIRLTTGTRAGKWWIQFGFSCVCIWMYTLNILQWRLHTKKDRFLIDAQNYFCTIRQKLAGTTCHAGILAGTTNQAGARTAGPTAIVPSTQYGSFVLLCSWSHSFLRNEQETSVFGILASIPLIYPSYILGIHLPNIISTCQWSPPDSCPCWHAHCVGKARWSHHGRTTVPWRHKRPVRVESERNSGHKAPSMQTTYVR